MKQPVLVEIVYTHHVESIFPGQLGLFTHPAVRFFDSEGQVVDLITKVNGLADSIAYAESRVKASSGIVRCFWLIYSDYTKLRRAWIIEAAISRTAQLIRKDYEGIELTYAWPSTSEEFRKPGPSMAQEIAHELLDCKDAWLQIRTLVSA